MSKQSKSPIKYQRPPLYSKQELLISDPARIVVSESSTKSGKTTVCLIWLFEQALAGPKNSRYLWVAPSFQMAGIPFGRLKMLLTDSGLNRRMWRVSEVEQIITINGRQIRFTGSDKPDSLYGDDAHAAVIDEASRTKEESWHAVRSQLTATGGPVRIIGNVRGRKNWAYQLARRAEAGEDGMSYHRLTCYDAVEGGVIEASEIEEARRVLPDNVFRELYLAEASDDGGNPFGLDYVRRCIKPLSSHPPVAFGVDLAKSVDWCVCVGLDSAGTVCSLERWRGDWSGTKRRIAGLIGDLPALIDSTGVGDPIVEEIQREKPMAEGFKFSSGSKQQLMEGLAVAIQTGEIGFPDGWLVKELESFEYVYSRSGVSYSAPSGLHDDGCCALALAVQKWRSCVRGGFRFNVLDPGGDDSAERSHPMAGPGQSRTGYSRGWVELYSSERGWSQ